MEGLRRIPVSKIREWLLAEVDDPNDRIELLGLFRALDEQLVAMSFEESRPSAPRSEAPKPVGVAESE